MAQVLTATHRLSIKYVIDGLNHVIRFHCSAIPTSTPGQYYLVDRAALNNVTVIAYATSLIQAMGNVYHNNAPAGMDWQLEARVGTVYNPIQAGTVSNASGITLPNVEAGQLTLYLRDGAFHKIRVQNMESVATGPQTWRSPAALPAGVLAYLGEFTAGFVGTNPPFSWVQSISGLFLAPSPFIKATMDYNRKIRRRRGLV